MDTYQIQPAQYSFNETSLLLNDLYAASPAHPPGEDCVNFPQFSNLPADIRWMVWQEALSTAQRIIHVWLEPTCEDWTPWKHSRPLYTSTNTFGNAVSGQHYRLRRLTKNGTTPLLGVNQEARGAAMKFYRVQVPLDFHGKGARPCLYFNPELDVLRPDTAKRHAVFVADLLADFRAYDPRGIGVRRLALRSTGGSDSQGLWYREIDASILKPEALSGLKSIVASLETAFFYHSATDWTRLTSLVDGLEEFYNRSFPIEALGESFCLLDVDPRTIAADLRHVSFGEDPNEGLSRWHEMERRLGISRSGQSPDLQVLVTASSRRWIGFNQIVTRTDAIAQLASEQESWRANWRRSQAKGFPRVADPDPPGGADELPLPAVGFWLFPANAMGEQPGTLNLMGGELTWPNKVFKDLTKYPPQLGLFQLQ